MKKRRRFINTLLKKITRRESRGFQIYYVNGADTLPLPLTPEEEFDILSRLDGDPRLRSVLVERNLRLVVYIAKKFESTGIGLEPSIKSAVLYQLS